MPLRNPITEPQIPQAIARDTEFAAADAAHVAAPDPHAQYLTQTEADARYRQNQGSNFFIRASFPTADIGVNSIAFGWNSIQPGQGIAELCNFAGSGAGDAFNFFRITGSSTTTAPTLSNRISRIDSVGAYIQVSDRRLKQKLLPSPGLAEVLALSPQRYQHYECLGFEEKKVKLGNNFLNKIGFLAQDVRKVIPEAVSAPQSEEELYGIDYNCIVACLVRAVQEQQQQIDELRAQLQPLKS